MNKKFDVLVVGELNVDIILDKIAGLPEVGKEKIADQLTVTLGSSSAIFASNLSTLGAKTVFVGKIGKDSHAKLVKNTLTSKKVNIEHVLETDAYQTGLTIVMNYGNDRANITYPGAMNHLKVDEIPDELLNQVKHLHLSSVFMQPGIKPDIVKLFKRAKDHGLTTSLDPQWDPSEKWRLDIETLLPLVDIFLPNTIEFQSITNTDSYQAGIEKVKEYAQSIVIKDGERGAHLWNNNELVNAPAFFNSNVADCIGAGDSFDAGFISQYILGKPLIECLKFGNLTGAINTTASGGTGAFKSYEKVKKTALEAFSVDI